MGRWWGMLAVLAASGWGVANAAQLELNRGELCALSDTVVMGEVTSLETRWSAGASGAIERSVWLAVSQTVKGAPAETVEVYLPGGVIGTVGHVVEDTPNLIQNGRYLLFLQQAEGTLRVVGGEQGAVRITPERARIGETAGAALATVEACGAK